MSLHTLITRRWNSLQTRGVPNTPKLRELQIAAMEWNSKGARCEYCGEKVSTNPRDGNMILSIDHRTPVIHGGDNRLANLAFTCLRCNIVKGTMLEQTYRKFLETVNGELLEQMYIELTDGRIAAAYHEKLTRDRFPEDIPHHLKEGYMNPSDVLRCPVCGMKLSAYMKLNPKDPDLICLNCTSIDKHEVTFKLVEQDAGDTS